MFVKNKKATLEKKILYPILFMVFFQILIFWLFVFQLGLFDSVIKQSKNNFLNNAYTNTQQIDSEMWFHFSDLSALSKSISLLEEEYIRSLENSEPMMITDEIIKSIVTGSIDLHIDGVYLELFQPQDKRQSMLFRFDTKLLPSILSQQNFNLNQEMNAMISEQSDFFNRNAKLRAFLNQIELSHQRFDSQNAFAHGNWSPVLTLDQKSQALLYAIPLTYQRVQYGFIGSEVSISNFDNLMKKTAFPNNFKHQALLVRQDSTLKNYEVISHIGFQGEKSSIKSLENTLQEIIENLDHSPRYFGEHEVEGLDYLCTANKLEYVSSGNFGLSNSNFYYVAIASEDTVLREANVLKRTFLFLTIILVLFSIIIALVITMNVVSPISSLTNSINPKALSLKKDWKLPYTEIEEIDLLTDTISSLNQNVQDFHQMITDTMISSETNLVTFYVDRKNNLVRGFGTFHALLGNKFAKNYILNLSLSEFEKLEQQIYHNFIPYSSFLSQSDDTKIQTDIYLDESSGKYICVKSREITNGRTIVMLDYTDYILEQEQIKKERDYDVLTSLLNRLSFTNKAEEYLENHPDKPVGMVMWDIDYLKKLNDTYGHDLGDSYLRAAGQILHQINPEKSFVSRVSGDEFFAFLYDYESKEDMVEEIESIHFRLNHTNLDLPNGMTHQMSASCGYTYAIGESYETLKKHADSAMYISKKSVKGSIHEFTHHLDEATDIEIPVSHD